MSGLALLFHRDGSPLPPDALTEIMARLAHRGLDGQSICNRSVVALGYQHFWITPEDTGTTQPLTDPRHQIDLLFDGRLDNRDELLAALPHSPLPTPYSVPSDATLVLMAYQRWGEDCLRRLLGSFAIAIYDATRHAVICARDAIGDRTLFYYLDERRLILASEEHALLAHPAVSDRLDERSLAYYYAVETPPDGATLFADVRELLPGHAVSVGEQSFRTWRHWQPDPEARLCYRSDADYAAHFRDLLKESVRCRLRSTTRPAVLMSGGLDSTSVAALAALTPAPPLPRSPSSLLTISWIFDELPGSDERPWIDALVAQYGCQSIQLKGDDAWPLSEFESWPSNPNSPEVDFYRRLNERAYQAAHAAGARTLLSGLFADDLYAGLENWLADLVAERRLRQGVGQLGWHVRHFGWRPVLRSRSLRRLGSRLLDEVPLARRLRPWGKRSKPAWLRPQAQTMLEEEPPFPGSRPEFAKDRWAQRAHMLSHFLARKITTERRFANQAGIELLYPYRDQRIIEFMLAIPSHQYYHQGQYKIIARNAMEGILPESVRSRTRETSLSPLYGRGISERATETVWQLLHAPDAAWRPYVSQAWLTKAVPASDWNRITTLSQIEQVAVWNCLSFERWRQTR